jgi:hypothetical protein
MLKKNPDEYPFKFSENVCDNRLGKHRKKLKKTLSLNEGILEKLDVLSHFSESGPVSTIVESAIEDFLAKPKNKKILDECYNAWREQDED